MSKKSGLIFTLIVLLFTNVYGQGLYTVGKVIDAQTSIAAVNVNVTAFQKQKIIYLSTTDSLGIFHIPAKFNNWTSIKLSSLHYNTFIIERASKDIIRDHINDLGAFKMEPMSIQLKQVNIKGTRRYRDTTKIDLLEKHFERNVMIDDLLSGEYGFSRGDNGQLFYKGKPVSDLTVNGSRFFGRDNKDIYQLLPALILANIKVIETNIDNLANTTLLRPTVKIDLGLKDKFKKGRFGNGNLSAGTEGRDLANGNVYAYKDAQQLSLTVNSNNINVPDYATLEPRADFAANSNNVLAHSATLSFRNVYAHKLEISLSGRLKEDDRNFLSESERQDETTSLFSRTANSSNTKTFAVNNSNLTINYIIDSLNTINAVGKIDYSNKHEIDSLDYLIIQNSISNFSNLYKQRADATTQSSFDITYTRRSDVKKGRFLTADFKIDNNYYDISEYDVSATNLNQYYINGHRNAQEHQYYFKLDNTEPLGTDAYLSLYSTYQKNILKYDTSFDSDTIVTNTDAPTSVFNSLISVGINAHKTFKRATIDANIQEVAHPQTIKQQTGATRSNLFNLNIEITSDYKINDKKSLYFNYKAETNYPDIQKLTSLRNTFDLVSVTEGNLFLKPEQIKRAKLSYIVKPTIAENITLFGQIDHYSARFGYNLSNGIPQRMVTDNVGSSNEYKIGWSFFKNVANDKFLSYTLGLNYLEAPSEINGILLSNNSKSVSQSFSTTLTAIKKRLSITPSLSSSYNVTSYDNNTINIFTLTYANRVSINTGGFQVNLYPLINYSKSIGSNHSFAMNGDIRKSIFKSYGSVWLQAYDIFNSFNYYNNIAGASYYQSVKYSNLGRYILLGLSFKLNNMN